MIARHDCATLFIAALSQAHVDAKLRVIVAVGRE
jgi:hypothetical protein